MAEDTKLEALRREIQKGLDSGPAVEFDIDAWFEEEFGAK
jgi:Arc/MetJ-type ribon-helix-helix transcriptional regulator